MKYVILVMDGAAGWPIGDLDGRTTLAAAETPNLDAMAREGFVGMAQTVPPGAEPSSSAACMSILGYDPIADAVGRGAIEAASMGIELADDEVALRMNLVHSDEGRMESYACGHIPTVQSRSIVNRLQSRLGDGTFRFHAGVAYRHILVVKGHPELMELSYTPPHDISDKPVAGHRPNGPGAALLLDLMGRAHEVLRDDPINSQRDTSGKLRATDIWPFWPGVRPTGLQPFAERHGVSAALTSGVDLLNGLAVLMGIDRIGIEGVTDGPDNDYASQIEGGLAALEDHDLVVVHVESPDETGHAGDTAGKVAAIEAIDAKMASRLREEGEGVRVLVMPDHPTPIELKTHVGEPVPFLVWGAGESSNGADGFNEEEAVATGVVVDPGRTVIGMLLGR